MGRDRDWYNSMTKQTATERAKKLQARLNKSTGGKWKIRVHDNLGWHFNVYTATISVSQYGAKEYSCLIGNGKYQFAGEGIWSIDNTSTTPEECIRKQLEEVRDVVMKYERALLDCEKATIKLRQI